MEGTVGAVGYLCIEALLWAGGDRSVGGDRGVSWVAKLAADQLESDTDYAKQLRDAYATGIKRGAMGIAKLGQLAPDFTARTSDGKPFRLATVLSDPAGYASATYGVARKCLRWGAWVENQPHWFVIDRGGKLTFILEPKFDTPTAYEKDVDLVLDALRKAARWQPSH